MSDLVPDARVYRGLVDAAPDALLVVDPQGQIRLANAQVQALFGWPSDELEGAPVETVLPRFVDAEPGTGATMASSDLLGVHRDGHEFPVEISLSPVQTEHGTFACAAVRDVSERMRSLVERERMRDDLLATVSHELRTPLTSIIGYAELLGDLDDDDVSPSARRLVEIIRRNANRELALVNDLITLAFLDDDPRSEVRDRVDLGEVVGEVIEDCAVRADEAGVELEAELGEPCTVLGEDRRLAQVVGNLVTNAILFNSTGGSVTVRLRPDGPDAFLEVEDSGIGIEQEHIGRIFERLHRAPRAVERQIPGAGLGLPIAEGIVTGLGGRIEVESTLDVGSTFRVVLPRAAGDDAVSSVSSVSSVSQGGAATTR